MLKERSLCTIRQYPPTSKRKLTALYKLHLARQTNFLRKINTHQTHQTYYTINTPSSNLQTTTTYQINSIHSSTIHFSSKQPHQQWVSGPLSAAASATATTTMSTPMSAPQGVNNTITTNPARCRGTQDSKALDTSSLSSCSNHGHE